MQSKVSIVMPCYNKVKYIANMLDSILAQEWNNIELVLVNDGSTDGTREIIAEYEPKFKELGYEVVIIDQENAGVCTAVKAGLERVTGNYICQVDADDELDTAYISVMARWLDENEDFDICKCSFCLYEVIDGENRRIFDSVEESGKAKEYIVTDENVADELDGWLLGVTTLVPWVYMVRKTYFDKCKIVKNFYVYTRGSHEPFYSIPLLAYGGKIKRFSELLYHFNNTNDESRHSHNIILERAKKHWNEYWRNARIAIKNLDTEYWDAVSKNRLLALLTVGMYRTTFLDFRVDTSELLLEQHYETLRLFDRFFSPHQIPYGLYEFSEIWNTDELRLKYNCINRENVYDTLVDFLILRELPPAISGFKKIIGFGSRGRSAEKLMPILAGSPMQPTELWDNQDGNCDFGSLSEKDCMLVFPVKGKILEEIKPFLEKSGCYVLYMWEIPKQYIAECLRQSILGNYL